MKYIINDCRSDQHLVINLISESTINLLMVGYDEEELSIEMHKSDIDELINCLQMLKSKMN
jgi:hypothetical protein